MQASLFMQKSAFYSILIFFIMNYNINTYYCIVIFKCI